MVLGPVAIIVYWRKSVQRYMSRLVHTLQHISCMAGAQVWWLRCTAPMALQHMLDGAAVCCGAEVAIDMSMMRSCNVPGLR